MSLTAELDRVEADARDGGSTEPLLGAAMLMGFQGWADVCRLARGEHRHPVAIELLCRRVERGL